MGIALTDLAPAGRVRLDSEDWSAISLTSLIQAGEPVRVVAVRGVTLHVAAAGRPDDVMM